MPYRGDAAWAAAWALQHMASGHSFPDFLIGQGLAAKTVRDYAREVNRAQSWFAHRGLSLDTATASELVDYASTRPNTPGVRAHMRAAFRYYWQWLEVDGRPNAIRVPTPAPMICKAFTEDEARNLARTAAGWWRAGAVVLCGLYMGLRNQELAGMRWDGFDGDFEWYTLIGKGNRQRTVAVHPRVAQQLAGHRNGSPYIFEGRFGGPVSHATINNWVREVARAAGINGRITPHRLRHTFAAHANDKTGDLRAVQAAMGHARPETTAGYTRATTVALWRVAQAIDLLE